MASDRDPVTAGIDGEMLVACMENALSRAKSHGPGMWALVSQEELAQIIAMLKVGNRWAAPSRGPEDPRSTMKLFRSDWSNAKESK